MSGYQSRGTTMILKAMFLIEYCAEYVMISYRVVIPIDAFAVGRCFVKLSSG